MSPQTISLQTVESSRTMHYPHDLDTIRKEPVKDQVVADGPMAERGGDVGPRATATGILGEEDAFAVNFFKESVRGVGVVVRDVDPDIDQIILCPGGATNDRHRA